MGKIAAWLMQMVREHGVAAVFVWGAAKSVLPVPTPSVLVLAGAARPESSALAALWPVLTRVTAPGALGITLGGFLYYELTRRKGPEFVARFGPKLGLRRRSTERLQRLVGGHRGLFVCALRAVPVVPVMLGSFVAGLAQQPPLEFAAWSFVGAALRCLLLAYAGFYTRAGVGALLRLAR